MMKTVISGMAVVAAVSSVSSGAVIYRETFGNAGAAQAALSSVGWAVNAHSTGDDINNPKTGSQDAAVSNIAGKPADQANVNAGASASNSLGVVFVTNSGTTVSSTDPVLFWTSEYTIDRSASTVGNFSFYMGNANTTDPLQVAIRVGSNWYVSNTKFRNSVGLSGGAFAASAELETLPFTTDASAWSNLNFTAGTSLAAGSVLTSDLPSGNITAFGLFSGSGRTGNVRFDTFAVDAIPEPAALGGLAVLGGFALRRRSVSSR